MEISEKKLLLRIIELVTVFILIILFFPAEEINAALSPSYEGWTKNIYLTLIAMLTVLVMIIIVNKTVRYLLPKHHEEAEKDIFTPEKKRLAELKKKTEIEIGQKAKERKKDEMKRKAIWHKMLRALGFLKTEKEKLAEKLEHEQRQRINEIERKIKKANERRINEKKQKTGWMKLLRQKKATREDIKKLEQEMPIPQKKMDMLQKSAPAAPKKDERKSIFRIIFAKRAEPNNEAIIRKNEPRPKKIDVPVPPKRQEPPKESIFNLISKKIEMLNHKMKMHAKKRERMKIIRKERMLKKESEKRMLESVSREEDARKRALKQKSYSERKLKTEEKEAEHKFGKVAKELSEKIQKKDSKLQQGEPESPEEKAKRGIFENIRQLFHPGIIAKYGIRRAEMRKLKMKRKEIEKEKNKLQKAREEFEQKKAHEEGLKRMLESSQMRRLEQQRKM